MQKFNGSVEVSIDGKMYYVNALDIQDDSMDKLWVFDDPDMLVNSMVKGKSLMVIKKSIKEKLK